MRWLAKTPEIILCMDLHIFMAVIKPGSFAVMNGYVFDGYF